MCRLALAITISRAFFLFFSSGLPSEAVSEFCQQVLQSKVDLKLVSLRLHGRQTVRGLAKAGI